MPDTFAITVVAIIVCAVFAAFIKGRSRDKCLVHFSGDIVHLQLTNGKVIWGRLVVENTGLELMYKSPHKDKEGHDETSYILYRPEYPTIQALIRYHDDLDESNRKRREKELKRTYHPVLLRRVKRKILNFFKTVRDATMELISMVIDLAKKKAPGGALLTSQDKYVSKMKQEAIGVMGTAFEPLLERHIGAKVVLALTKDNKIYEYAAVLKEYTSEYIELMDVDYKIADDAPVRRADIVVPRQHGLVRHLGEKRSVSNRVI